MGAERGGAAVALLKASASQLLRLAALSLLLFIAAKHGALPLLGTTLGVLMARSVILWREGRAA
jgi:hypothetical protein